MTSKLRECQVTKFLANFCMPWMSNGKQSCAHPSYDGKVCFSVPFLAFLHRLVDLCKLTKGRVVKIVANWQGKIEAGLYALIHLFDPVDVKDLESPNTLEGHFTPHFYSNNARPALFLVHIKAIQLLDCWVWAIALMMRSTSLSGINVPSAASSLRVVSKRRMIAAGVEQLVVGEKCDPGAS